MTNFDRIFLMGISFLLVGNVFFIGLFSSTKAPFSFPLALVAYLVFYGVLLCIAWRKVKKYSIMHQLLGINLVLLPASILIEFFTIRYAGKIDLNDLVLSSGFVIIPLFLALITYILYSALPGNSTKNSEKKQKFSPYFLVYVLVFMFIGLQGISEQSLVDEPLWIYDRVESYALNILELDFRHTRPSDKPGVPVSIASGISLLKYHHPSALEETITPDVLQDMLLWMRAPIVIAVSGFLLVFAWFLNKFFGSRVAHFSMLLISFSPLLIGMSRMINPDAFLWILMPLTYIAFVYALYAKEKKYIILAGIFFGITLLTKYVGNVFFVFFPVLMIMAAYFNTSHTSSSDIVPLLRRYFHIFGIFALITIITIIVLLPSTWVYPIHILKTTILSQAFESLWLPFAMTLTILYADLFINQKSYLGKILEILIPFKKYLQYAVVALFGFLVLFTLQDTLYSLSYDFQSAVTSPKSAVKQLGEITTFFTGFYVLIFGVHSVVLFGVIITLFKLHQEKSGYIKTALYGILLFIPFYYLGALLGDVASTLRYQIALYPLFFIVAAYGFAQLAQWKDKVDVVIFVIIAGVLLHALLLFTPYYFSYHSSLLPQGHILNVKDMGDGSYQAAQYLNQLPNAQNLTIWADKSGVCAMFVGKCSTSVNVARIAQKNMSFDYFVVSATKENLMVRSANHDLKSKKAPEDAIVFARLYEEQLPYEYEILLGTRADNFIRIFNAGEINLKR